jgi:8-oxo-dGTP diphosphatase
MHVQTVVLAVIKHQGKILLTKRIDDNPNHHGLWQLPGGGLEFGEKPIDTLHREMKEELSAKIKDVLLINYIDTKVLNKWQGIFISYSCRLNTPLSEIVLNEEASEWRLFDIEELDYSKFDIFEGCVEVVKASFK